MRATFAYFTASVSGNDTASSVIVKTETIGTITYAQGSVVSMENALPGDSATLDFTITADGDSKEGVSYRIEWAELKNEFTNKADLVYSLDETTASTGTVVEKTNEQVPSAVETIGTGRIMPNETHTYKLTVHYKETGSEQNSDQGKTFAGKLKITTGDEEGNTYYTASNRSGTTTEPSSEAE